MTYGKHKITENLELLPEGEIQEVMFWILLIFWYGETANEKELYHLRKMLMNRQISMILSYIM